MRDPVITASYQRLLVLVGSLFVAFYLLLVQSQIEFHSLFLTSMWDRAHVFLFIALTFAFDYAMGRHRQRALSVWLRLLVLPLLVLAFATEALQSLTERTASLGDVGFNSIGILIATLLLAIHRYAFSKLNRNLMWLTAALSLAGSLWQPARCLFIDAQAWKDFPVISNMERYTDNEIWNRGEISSEQFREGHAALKVSLKPVAFSGASARHFPADWSHFQRFNISIFNPGSQNLALSLRISDAQHEAGAQPPSDRYEHEFNAVPGWNDLSLSLDKIAHAPRTRLMNMSKIYHIRVYAQTTHTAGDYFYIDNVYLN